MLVALCVSTVLLVSACASNDTKVDVEPVVDDAFSVLVAEADSVMESGDAKEAYRLYWKALAMESAEDPDGVILTRQEDAKHLFTARDILGSLSLDDVPSCVEVIVDHSVAETEGVEAKRRIHGTFQYLGDFMGEQLVELRADVEAGDSFGIPISVIMASSNELRWAESLARIDGSFGEDMVRANELLVLAAAQATACRNHQWIDECVAELDLAEDTLAELQKHLDASAP
jgi:hypothetical protein